ncbi:MAG TPA: chemotaxis protein CheX [Bryobacteraceae bacterium]|nr:chemotaxis protein CheX [Bryobacteraceae bacterium]
MTEMSEAISTAAADVLETMFFSPVMAEVAAEAGMPAATLAARLQFSGGRSGTFAVRISTAAAENMAANFLGEEAGQPASGQVQDVICELTNMLCGSVLSRLDREAHFDLGHPELVDPLEVPTPGSVSRAFDLGEGQVAIFLHLDAQP